MMKRSLCLFVAVALLFPVKVGLAAQDGKEIRVFTLVKSDCKAMFGLISDLSNGEMNGGFDERTNSLIMVGDREALGAVEALLLKLDSIDTWQPEKVAAQKKGDSKEKQKKKVRPEERELQERELQEVERREREEQERLERREREEQERLEQREREELEQREREEIERRRDAERQEEVERIEKKTHRGNLERRAQLLGRRIEMMRAQGELEIAMMESAVMIGKAKLEALNAKATSIEETVRTGNTSKMDLVMIRTEIQAAEAEIASTQRKIEFHRHHALPTKILELEIELKEAHAALERSH